MAGTELDVAYVARLARLQLTEDEARLFQEQLGDVLRHVGKLKEVDVSDVEPDAHTNAIVDFVREDEPQAWFTAEEALRNAPRQANGLFVVPKVVE
ncbi:MAG: Asp-tRNA(Asn)/Glu-tRNA(Gln) amidotransferase subunit GatC [Verrucomicrobiota bacterium]|nr:Asp-tRNA(Asn)/Glu-tRNA(Gln) amidotransferase subunit GatC [Verrucomicrobiota bacterium]